MMIVETTCDRRTGVRIFPGTATATIFPNCPQFAAIFYGQSVCSCGNILRFFVTPPKDGNGDDYVVNVVGDKFPDSKVPTKTSDRVHKRFTAVYTTLLQGISVNWLPALAGSIGLALLATQVGEGTEIGEGTIFCS